VATPADPQYAAAIQALQAQISARRQQAQEVIRSSSR